MNNLTRRDAIRAASVLPFASMLGARAAEPDFQGMIVRQSEPQNLEMPFASLSEWKVPTERFYVRSHFPLPKIDAKAFKLVVSERSSSSFRPIGPSNTFSAWS